MKICIVGTGAMGVLLGMRLTSSDHSIVFIDQEKEASLIKKNGLKLISPEGEELVADNIKIYDSFTEAGAQDLVILALKAHQIENIANQLPLLFNNTTAVMSLQNGIPWWYFQRHGGEYDNRSLKILDPEDKIKSSIDPKRIIGCVAYPAAAATETGVVQHIEGNRFTIGELDGSVSQRCQDIAELFIASGFKSYVIEDIRAEIWLKVWGSLSFNTISALTRATMEQICLNQGTRDIVEKMMTEAQVVANKLGIQFRHTIEKRIAGAQSVGAHKTSMLQDVEAGRSIEIDAIIGAVLELAEMTETSVPTIQTVYGCCHLLNKTLVAEQ